MVGSISNHQYIVHCTGILININVWKRSKMGLMARKDKYHICVEKGVRTPHIYLLTTTLYAYLLVCALLTGQQINIYPLPYHIGGYWSQTRRQSRSEWSADIYAASCADGDYLLPPLLACTINAHKLTITNHRILQLVRLPCLNVHLITKLLISQQYNYIVGQHICLFPHMTQSQQYSNPVDARNYTIARQRRMQHRVAKVGLGWVWVDIWEQLSMFLLCINSLEMRIYDAGGFCIFDDGSSG